jgi:hypothetical protein
MELALVVGLLAWALGLTLIAVVSLVLAVVAWISVFRDPNLSAGSRALWFFTILIFPIFGSVVYFGVRSSW